MTPGDHGGVTGPRIPRAPGRWLDALSWAALVAFAASMGLGVLLPLYVDEVATKLVQARFFADGGQMVSLFPQCAAGFVQDTPLTWYPAALVFGLLYGPLPPLGLRLAGIGVLLAFIAAFIGWVRLTVPDARGRLHAIAGLAALLGLGVLPLTLVLARPEQWLVLLLTAFLLLVAGADRLAGTGRAWMPAALCATFLLMTSLLNYAHPKALFFLPFVIIAAACVFGARHRWLLLLTVSFAVVAAYQTFGFARAVTRCDESPILAGILAAQTTDISLAFRDPAAFAGEALRNLAAAPGSIAAHGVFQSAFQSAWLPPVPFAASALPVRAVNLGATGSWYLACLLGLLLPPLAFLRSPGAAMRDPRRLLYAALWIGLVGHVALYKEWNFYGGSLVVALLAVLLVPGVTNGGHYPWLRRAATGALAAVLLLCLASTAVLMVQFGPRLLKVARSGEEVPGNQQYSVNAFAYSGARDRIRYLAEACGIPGDGSTRLVVDDLAYFAFKGLKQPLHLGFLWPGGWGADIAGRTRDLLEGLESDGIIGQCSLVPPEFRNQTLRDGNLCCVDLKDRTYF